MTLLRKTAVVCTTAALAMAATACGDDSTSTEALGSVAESAVGDEPAGTAAAASAATTASTPPATGDGGYPLEIEHALGTTVLEAKPERVVTVNWANHEVPLALGVVPVGMAAANWADPDGDGLLPWQTDRLAELGADTPVLFDENDGIDFEAVADTNPDVILAAYSGLTQEDYDTLSAIAPTVAYPNGPWATNWRDMIRLNSAGMGMAAEGDALIAEIEAEIAAEVAKHPELAGKSAVFAGHLDPSDLSEIGFYTAHDTRVQFFDDLGLTHASVVADYSAENDTFSGSVSTEQIQLFDDVDVIVGYGDDDLLAALQADPLASKIPALQRGSVVFISGDTPLGTAANPTPLAISYVLSDYVAMLAEAAGKAE